MTGRSGAVGFGKGGRARVPERWHAPDYRGGRRGHTSVLSAGNKDWRIAGESRQPAIPRAVHRLGRPLPRNARPAHGSRCVCFVHTCRRWRRLHAQLLRDLDLPGHHQALLGFAPEEHEVALASPNGPTYRGKNAYCFFHWPFEDTKLTVRPAYRFRNPSSCLPMSALSIGYIRSPAADWFWFILLPPLAVAFALLSDHYLTFVALASISLWITVPHHFGTWCRTYGLSEDWRRFQLRVIVGPILIVAAIVFGFTCAPLTIFILTTLWDHQHSCMQQYGLGRIYDFKAKTGGPKSGQLDLWLMVALYINHLVTTPLWTEIWVQQLYTWRMPVTSQFVLIVQAISYALTGGVAAWYALGVLDALKQGHRLNPMKYLFLASSFGLWYFCAWQTNSLLVYGIAHKIMHGLQYLVFVYWFLERKQTVTHAKPWMLPRLNVIYFTLAGISLCVYLSAVASETGQRVFLWLAPVLRSSATDTCARNAAASCRVRTVCRYAGQCSSPDSLLLRFVYLEDSR